MKNLKRVLSLGLASVMLLGMMVMGASAAGKDFTDAEDITHDEAVQVLVALNVINGKEDGSYFAPKDNVSRAEMAKMITVVMMGGTDVNSGVKGTPSFTDIAGTWAEGYIEYCYDMGIISGRGDGTFDPNGNVTVTEAAKMLLTAMGYNAEAYKLTGAGWSTATNELARSTMYGNVKLYDSLNTVILSEPASRDVAAQMIWNALQGVVVKITPDRNTNTGEVTWTYNTTGTETLIEQRYKAFVETGTFVGNKKFGATTAEKGEIGVVFADTATWGSRPYTFPYDLDIDYVGEEVKVIWRNGVKDTSDGPDKHDDIYGAFVTGATQVLRTTVGKMKDNKVAGKQQINVNDTKYDVADTVTVYTNYVPGGTPYSGTGVKPVGDVNSGLSDYLHTGANKANGDDLKMIFNDKGEVETIYETEHKIAAVTSINSTKITLNNGVGTLTIADHNIEEGLKKGDVVEVTALYDTTPADGVCTVKKAEKVSGELTAYLNDETVTVGGKKYTLYNKTTTPLGDGDIPELGEDVATNSVNTGNRENTWIGEEFDLYLVAGYVGAMVQTSKGARNYSVITEVKQTGIAGSVFTGLQLQVMGADGTKEVISVSKESTKTGTHDPDGVIDQDDYRVGDIITYVFDGDDFAEVTVRGLMVDSNTNTTGVKYNATNKTVETKTTTADCLLFVQTNPNSGTTPTPELDGTGDTYKVLPNAEWEVYNIRDLDDIERSASKDHAVTVATDSVTGKVVAVFMDLKAEPNGAADNTVYGIISAYNGRVKDYFTYTVQANGEEYTIKIKNDSANDLKKGYLVKFRPTADDTYGKGKVEHLTFTTTQSTVGDGEDHLVYVDEYSARDNTITVFFNVTRSGSGTSTDPYIYDGDPATRDTYALDKDCKIVFVDQDGNKSLAETSIDQHSETKDLRNAAMVLKEVDGDDIVVALFIETSGKKSAVDE